MIRETMCVHRRRGGRARAVRSIPVSIGSLFLLVSMLWSVPVRAQDRVLGLDVSAWQGNISQTTWNNILDVDQHEFVFIRSSRGGTTGFYNQSDPNNNNGQNTLSQRYDDPYFVQNITRATNAGLYAGAYHFSRPDIVASTLNSNGIANSGADEADHFIQMAGAWMRPGYLMPVHDLEAGEGNRTDNQMAQFAIDFSDRMMEVMGIRPAIYIGGNYAAFVVGGASEPLRNEVVEKYPILWSARWPNQANPDAIPIQTGHPKDSFTPIYGPWDDPPNPEHPWSFWQYASTGRLSSFNNGNTNLDVNVAQGDIEFVKDRLVPAVWLHDAGGEWTDLANWNSGVAPIVPVQGLGQVPRVGPLTLPTERLPTGDDTVVLDRPGADIAVRISTGNHSIRKLELFESLTIDGGSLSLSYEPSVYSTPYAAYIGGDLTVAADGHLAAHTIWLDPAAEVQLGGTVTFDTLRLTRGGDGSSRLLVAEPVTLRPWQDGTGLLTETPNGGDPTQIDLGGAHRIWNIENGGAAIDIKVDVPIVNGQLFKDGDGTLQLSGVNTYGGDVVVRAGGLVLSDPLIGDTSDVYLGTGVGFTLDFAGEFDVVGAAYLSGIPLAVGTWGAPGSGAQFTSPFLSGPGTMLVTQLEPLLPGDFNENGVVDAADFTVWRDHLGQQAVLPFHSGDADGDGVVTQADYDIWVANFGMTDADVAALRLVPEPYGVGCIALGLALAVHRRRRSHKRTLR